MIADLEECQNYSECGGFCETAEEIENNMCENCLGDEKDREEDSRLDSERCKALQDIAVAAGIDWMTPSEVSRIVCKKLREATPKEPPQPHQPSKESIEKLRAATGHGLMDCARALRACNDCHDLAIKWLHYRGLAGFIPENSRDAWALGKARDQVDFEIQGKQMAGSAVTISTTQSPTPTPIIFSNRPIDEYEPICATCGKEAAYNVPRLGPAGGFSRHKDGTPLCLRPPTKVYETKDGRKIVP